MTALWTPKDGAPGVEVCRSGHEVVHRAFAPPRFEARAVDEDQRLMDFVLSTGSVDSYLTRVPVKGWDLRKAKNYAPWLAFHSRWTPAVGRIMAARKVTKGPAEDHRLEVRVRFAGDAQRNALAETLWLMYLDEYMKECSAGFVPLERKEITEESGRIIIEFTRALLIEGSAVNLGATPGAEAVRGDGIDERLERMRALANSRLEGDERDEFMRALTEPPERRSERRDVEASVIAEFLGDDDYDPAEDRGFGSFDEPVGGRVEISTSSRSSGGSPEVPSSSQAESGGAGDSLPSAPPDGAPAARGDGDDPEEGPDREVRAWDEMAARLAALEQRLGDPPSVAGDPQDREAPESALALSEERLLEILAEHEARICRHIDVTQADVWGDQQDVVRSLITEITGAHDPTRDPARVREAPEPPAAAPNTVTLTRAELEKLMGQAADRSADLTMRRYRGEITV